MNKETPKKAPVKRTRASKKPEAEPAEPLMVSLAVDERNIYPDADRST